MDKWEIWFNAYCKNYGGTGLLAPRTVAQQAWQAGETVAEGAGRVGELHQQRKECEAALHKSRVTVFEQGKRLFEAEQVIEKLKSLLLLTDPVVSSQVVGELSLTQWNEFTRWEETRLAKRENKES